MTQKSYTQAQAKRHIKKHFEYYHWLPKFQKTTVLTLIWVGFLLFCFAVGWVKLLLCLKLVRIMLEIWNLVGTYTHICSFRKKYLLVPRPLNFADGSFGKNSTFTQGNSIRAVLDIF